jgi:hypothetical protein
MTNWTEGLLEAIDRLTSHGDSPNGPGHRLILTVDVDELERLAAEARTALAQPEPEVAGAITDGRPMNQSYWLALLRHDAYAASFQSVDQYRSALIERASSPRAQPEPDRVGDEEIEQEAIANADTDDEYRAFKSGAFFVQERISRPTIKPEVPAPMSADTLAAIAIQQERQLRLSQQDFMAFQAAINAQLSPVPVVERPWEREGWCDAEGFCWEGSGWTYDDANEVEGYATWTLVPANEIRGDVSLPHHALPVPGAEVGS